MRSLCAISLGTLVAVLVGCGSNSGRHEAAKSDAASKTASAAPLKDPAEPTDGNTEEYVDFEEQGFVDAAQKPLSTFSVDVDTASYANARRMLLREVRLPPSGAVRIEEFVNYFPYEYHPPADDKPFAVHVETAACPWNERNQLVRIALKAREVYGEKRPDCNLVFLVDTSGSMQSADKLPLVRSALKLMVEQMEDRDRIAIVAYAGAPGLVLPSTPGHRRATIVAAIDRLEAGGSTNGGAGIELAYRQAVQGFIEGGANRVILCTDGDFNVGVTNTSDLTKLIEEKRQTGVYLSVMGFGTGNYKDHRMEELSNKGNGNAAYIDSMSEARKVFVEELAGTLVTIAKDVKIQVDINSMHVKEYRLIGYDNRRLRNEDFKNDAKDAGEIGAGHAVTALYEIVPHGAPSQIEKIEPSRYAAKPVSARKPSGGGAELLTVRLRYKEPDGEKGKEFHVAVRRSQPASIEQASSDFRFAAAVTQAAMLLRGSKFKGASTYADAKALAKRSLGVDLGGYRAEFLQLLDRAEQLSGARQAAR